MPNLFSLRLRSLNKRRSRSMPVQPSSEVTKTCLIKGMAFLARSPRFSGRIGTSRQPTTRSFSSIARFAKADSTRVESSASRKTKPAPYSAFAGSLKSTTARKNASGICDRIPAPSPVPASDPTAPRCSRLRSAFRAVRMMSWPAVPRRVATIARPQASRSRLGS